MPRTARKKSSTGCYHVILRGIGKQVLFEEEEDYLRFLNAVRRCLAQESFEVIAYCLMENHVHLLLRAASSLDRIMKRIAGSYAFYFNTKYERTGHLFQDRYMSEPVEDERYLLTVVRYIHNNPEKAGLCAHNEYRWSSWHEYVSVPDIASTALVLDLVGGLEWFFRCDESVTETACMDISGPRHISDEKALRIIKATLKVGSGTQLQELAKRERDQALRVLKKEGLSVRQIERLTGINRGVILRA